MRLADGLLEQIYDEAEPITDAGLTPMGVGDVSGYRINLALMQMIENYLEEYWDRLETRSRSTDAAPAGNESEEELT